VQALAYRTTIEIKQTILQSKRQQAAGTRNTAQLKQQGTKNVY
jgi:hypothetical protein